MAASIVKAPVATLSPQVKFGSFSGSKLRRDLSFNRFQKAGSSSSFSVSAAMSAQNVEALSNTPKDIGLPIMVNSGMGKMGKAVIEAAANAGLHIVPVTFGAAEESCQSVHINGKEIYVRSQSEREDILASTYEQYPNLIVVDYTVPTAVNDNAELYCKIGVPFVIGTTGGDREKLRKTVEDSNNYAVISPQMGKQVVAFLAAMEIMAEQFPGAFSGYSLQVMESHQSNKKDASGTAKAVISSFQKLGVDFDMDEIQLIRDPQQQVEMHNVCGRSIYAEGTVDAVLFLAKKVQSKAPKKIYDMIDVLREGNMR